MTRSWIAVALLAGGWLYGTSFYHPSVPWVWALAVLAAVLLLARAPLRVPRPIVALVAAALTVPAFLVLHETVPYVWIPGLVMFGCLLLAGRSPEAWPSALGRGAVATGAILSVQALVLFGYESLTARAPLMPVSWRDLLARLFALTGMDAAVDGQDIVVFAMREKQAIAATWNLIADPVSVLFLTGGLVMLALRGTTWMREAAAVSVALLLWLPIRATLFVAIYLHRVLVSDYDGALASAAQFWSPAWHVVLLIPALILARLVTGGARPASGAVAPPRPFDDPRRFAAAALTTIAVLVLTLAVVWKPSGPRKAGRVLIDEYHCVVDEWTQWRWPQKDFDTTSTLRPYDAEWHGQASGYNYATLYEYCSRFYTMGRILQPIADAALENCDVLVLKVPSRPFEPAEVDAVLRFVERGGGLFLLGEHTAVFGSGRNLNQIAPHFGFTFRYDCLFGIDSVFKETYEPPPVPHPIVQHMGPLDFATSCSIDPGLSPGCAVIRNTGLKNLDSDYHASNFYPVPNDAPHMLYGSFVQLWATDHGRGRVVAFTDSTIFANFSLFDPGKSQLFLGMLEWLNHAPRPFGETWLLVFGLLLALAAGWAWVRWSGDGILGLAGGLAGWALAVWVVSGLHTSAMPEPTPEHPLVRVAVNHDDLSRIELPVGGFIGGKSDGFGLFERSIQRLTKVADFPDEPGRTWTSFRAQGDAAFDADLAVFILPSKEPDEDFLRDLERYVDAGGKLLVLDAPENTKSTADKLVSRFGFLIQRDAPAVAPPAEGEFVPESPITAPDGWPSITVTSAFEILGGVPLCRQGDRTVAASVRHGKGTVTVIGFGTRFSDANMGITDQEPPTAEIRRVFDFELSLLGAIADDRLPLD